ncbi:hypothetical protein [uncultured Kushneria sp.]|uniref:hypothetical protein n=1 Tax=uncultured Kushneria sp. TaxID=905033 RepID=UPI0026262C8D|nr:hypothetical protein [uncultured Kushneria sp.]
MSAWEHLGETSKNVYRQLGTRDPKAIRRLKTKDLESTIRESQFVGYSDGAPFDWLIFEYNRRNQQKNKRLIIAGICVSILSIFATFLVSFI